MYIMKFLARFVGLTVADVVSAAKIGFAPWRVNRSCHPQLKEVTMGIVKKLVASIAGLNPAGAWSAAKLQSLFLTLILMVAALGVGSAVGADKMMVKDPTTGKMVTAPEYGGSLTFSKRGWPANTDTLAGGRWASQLVFAVLDKPSVADWGINRDTFALHMPWPPIDFLRGSLVEQWVQPDALTIIFHLRRGVHWHDKAPMNGREFTADDMVFNFHRMLGLGSGFTEPSPQLTAQLAPIKVESVTARDKYTVIFKLKEPHVGALQGLVDDETAYMYPPEVIKQHGDAKDWKVLVGTGPFELTDVVTESSATWTRNPNYWGFDEKFPENRLPYVDELRALYLPEVETLISAIRTRKVDIGHRMSGVDQAISLQQTNPEIQVFTLFFRSNESFSGNVQMKPFDDIRVRKALQMALDLETANKAYFHGLAEMTPFGKTRHPRQFVPFAEWPEEVKKVFTYDPEGAEALLDEAGYPRGSDGIRFKTVLKFLEPFNVGYAELATGFWREIGVDVKIELISGATFNSTVTKDRDFEMVVSITANLSSCFHCYSSGFQWNSANAQDPWVDAKVEAAQKAASRQEMEAIASELDMYGIEKFWTIWGGMGPGLVLAQPWVNGYSSELNLGSGQYWLQYSRMWIDSALKKEMGQ